MRVEGSIAFIVLLAACGVETGTSGDQTKQDGSGSGSDSDNDPGDGSDDDPKPGPGDDPGTGGTSELTPSKFFDEMGHKLCDHAHSCRASFPVNDWESFEDYWADTPDQCYPQFLAVYEPAELEQAFKAGTIKFTVADATTCLAGITFGTCSEFWDDGASMPAACDTAVIGTVQDGGACVIDLECANESSYCDASTDTCSLPE
jgi:hypothetical protein